MSSQSEFSDILNNSHKMDYNAHIYDLAEDAYENRDYAALGAAISDLIAFEKSFSKYLND